MLRNLALAVASGALTLLLLEVALRVVDTVTSEDLFDVASRGDTVLPERADLGLADLVRISHRPDLIYELRPGVHGRFVKAQVAINEQGFRGPPVAEGSHPGALRILALGDSITFGWGVELHETFLQRLAARLQTDHPNGPPVETVNLGVPGYNTYQEVEAFAAKGLAFRPDIVIIFLCHNDVSLPNFLWKRDPWSVNHSYLYELTKVRIRLLVGGTGGRSSGLRPTVRRPGPGRWLRTDDPRLVPRKWRHMVGVEAVERALQRLATLCAPSHVPVIYASYRNALDDRVRGTARRLGFIVVNVDGRARARLAATGRDYSSLRLSASDPHPSPEYHALIADAIYEDAVRPWLLARHREAAEPR